MRTLLRTVLPLLLIATSAFAAGRELAPRPLIPASESFENLGVASSAGRFLTVWQQDSANGLAIYGRIADEDGQTMTPFPFLIAETTRAGVSDLDVVGADHSFAVFYTDEAKAVHMANVTLDAFVVGTRMLDLPRAAHMSVAWDGERFLAAVFRHDFSGDRVFATFLERDGTITGSAMQTSRMSPPPPAASSSSPAVVTTSHA